MRALGWRLRGLAISLGIAPLGCVYNRPLPPSAPAAGDCGWADCTAYQPPQVTELVDQLPSGCAFYKGAARGNDPSMEVSLALCPAPGGFVGWARYVSSASGWSHREVSGAAAPDGSLALRDSRMVESHPAHGWELCLVDEYRLREVSPGVIEGSYSSSACLDQAVVALRRVR